MSALPETIPPSTTRSSIRRSATSSSGWQGLGTWRAATRDRAAGVAMVTSARHGQHNHAVVRAIWTRSRSFITGQFATVVNTDVPEADTVSITMPARRWLISDAGTSRVVRRRIRRDHRPPGPVLIDLPRDVANPRWSGTGRKIDMGYKPT